MNKRIIFSTCVTLVCVAAGVSAALAQGRYVNVYNRAQVEAFVRQLEESSNTFRNDFRREVNNSRLNSSTKRTYNGYAEQFENAVDRLRSRFNSNDTWWESRNEVRNMISNSQNLNTVMNQASFRRRIEQQWNRLRNDINRLADTYDLPGLAGGGWTGGGVPPVGGGGFPPVGGVGTRPPTWAQGTFYGTAPNGSQITLTITANGQATANINGAMSYGAYNRGILTMGYHTARVTRLSNGIRTVSTANRETINYSRTGWGGGGVPPIGGGNPPSWAVGSFIGQNPIDGSSIFLNVARNGTVTVTVGGSQSFGTMNGSMLTIGYNAARVYREGNGFRTVSTGDGQTIYYRRN
jgi:hypothetical protein